MSEQEIQELQEVTESGIFAWNYDLGKKIFNEIIFGNLLFRSTFNTFMAYLENYSPYIKRDLLKKVGIIVQYNSEYKS